MAKRYALWILFPLIGAGCSDCRVGSTWCEDNVVMVCVADYEGDGDEAFDDEDDALFIAALEAADNDTHSEVLDDCDEINLVCMAEDEDGEVYAECGAPVGVSWMYD